MMVAVALWQLMQSQLQLQCGRAQTHKNIGAYFD
jgi:hypothetical protein